MIGQHFNISKYNWDINIFYDVDKRDISFCIKTLNKYTKRKHFHKECIDTLGEGIKDRAYVYTAYDKESTVLFISPYSSTGEFLSTIAHEANHIKSHIATYYDLNEKDEEVCYIIGTIVKEMSNVFMAII